MGELPHVTANPKSHSSNKTYHCGTLTYAKIGLVGLFASLLWGDFCFTLMETVVPSILPLKLKALGCSNWMMGFILSTVPSVLSITVCPYISFKSDRYRSKWGRRIPFIACTMPFLCISLAMLGWSSEIQVFLQAYFPALNRYAPSTVAIGLIALFMAMFQFYNMFVSSLFFSLFNDVIPPQFIGRFIGLLRIVSAIAATLYNYFIFQFAESHMREIFLGAALIYFIGLGMMCFMVKEGEYPTIEGETDKGNRGLKGIKTFFKECFTHKFYWLIFSALSIISISYAIGTFEIFFRREMNLSLDQIGKMAAITGVATIIAAYFGAIFIDRWHPLRVTVYIFVFSLIAIAMNWVWIFITLPGIYYFWLCLGGNLIATFQTALSTATGFPMQVRLFPQSRFAQFCSAQGVIRSFCTMGAGVIAGLFIDAIRYFCDRGDFAYRFNFVWILFFFALGTTLILIIYVNWYKLGGDANYHPPAPWSPKGVEEMPIVPTVGVQSRWLNIALRLFDLIMLISVLGIFPLMWWMNRLHAMKAFYWFAVLLLPLSVLAWLWWKFLERSIRKDMERARNGEALRNGFPHHGLLTAMGVKFLLATGLWVAQIIITVNMKMETEAVIFGLGNIVTNFLLVGSVWLFTRIERGHLTTLDKQLA